MAEDPDDPRLQNQRYGDHEQIEELLRLEQWIHQMMEFRDDTVFVMKSNYLPEIVSNRMCIQVAPHIYCLYDFVDEFLEEGGIEVSYFSNFIRFREIQINASRFDKEPFVNIYGVHGLLVIGWGEIIIGILKSNKIKILEDYKLSVYTYLTRFNSEVELERKILQIRLNHYKDICSSVNFFLLKIDINQFNTINLGLKRYIKKDEIKLSWFHELIREKIKNIIKIDFSGRLGLNQLVNYLNLKESSEDSFQ
jgi:hypothetical protein